MSPARRWSLTALAATPIRNLLAGCEFVAFDLETTGLYPYCHRIAELGAVRFRSDGTELARYSQLVNPGRRMPPDATAIHGVTDAMLRHQLSLDEVLPEFLEFLGPHRPFSWCTTRASTSAF